MSFVLAILVDTTLIHVFMRLEFIEQRNAGYAQDVPEPLLKKLGMWKFDDKTHHQDIRAAARLGLFWSMRNDIEDVVTDIGLKLQEQL